MSGNYIFEHGIVFKCHNFIIFEMLSGISHVWVQVA
jgi:hypothetical protein